MRLRFNTQSPEGGCVHLLIGNSHYVSFNTQSPEGGCPSLFIFADFCNCFNTQSPEGGCSLYKKMIKISKLFTVFRYPLKHKEYQEV